MSLAPGGVVLVTGAASGIGAAIADALLERGATVVAVDRRSRASADRLHPFLADVTDEAAIAHLVGRVEQEIGPIEGLVNAAGVLPLGQVSEGASFETLEQALAVNAGGVWNTARAALPAMIARGRGALVTVASNAAHVPRIGMAAYCASKAAASMLTRTIGLEVARHGIRCNVVSPGSTDTPMLRAMLGESAPSSLVEGKPEAFRLGIPLGRVAAARDVAEVVVFLLSERARHVTLQDVRVDGGATL